MNNVNLIGRLTRDPEVRYSQAATPIAVARYSLAVRKQFIKPGEQDCDFINIIAFGKTGEFAEKYLKKGDQVGVTGRIQTGSYEKDGKRIYTFDVVAEHHTLLGKSQSATTSTTAAAASEPVDEDLPF